MSVFLDDLATPVLTVPLDLSSTLDLDGGRAWVGFTAATGGGWQNHDILNWEYGLRIEPTAIVSIDNTSAIEGNQAGNQLLFPVTATRLGDTSEPVTVQVHYATADGTAQDGGAGEDNDYQATAGTLTFEFAAGQMELAQTIAVTLQGDVVEEADETITLTLSAAANATISGGVAVGTILNDESTISIDDATAVEGSASLRIIDRLIDANGVVSGPMRSLALGPDGNGDGRQDLYVVNAGNDEVLRYDGLSGAPIDVFVSSGAGGLANPVDLRFGPDGNLYVTSGGTSADPQPNEVLRFDGQSGAFIDVAAAGLQSAISFDFGDDGNLYVANRDTNTIERFDSTTGQSLGVLIADAAGTTGDLRMATFGEDLDGDGVRDLYVVNREASQIVRYDGSVGALIDSINIPIPGLALSWIDVGQDGSIYASVRTTAGERMILSLDGASGAILSEVALGRDGWSLTVDDNNIVYVSGNGGGQVVDRLGPASVAALTVSLSNPSGFPVTVDFSTADGTALAGADYNATGGTLTFAPGETTKTILVHTIDDENAEPDETFTVSLSNPSANAQLSAGTGTGTIADDEANDPPIAVDDTTTVMTQTEKVMDVLANDSDPDGDALAIVSVSPTSAGGTVVINPDNTLSYTSALGYTGSDSFSYTASDGRGGEATATVTIEVTGIGMYVHAISFESQQVGNGKWRTTEWRTVFSIRAYTPPSTESLGGVAIVVTFNGYTYEGETDSDGQFRTPWQSNLASGSYTAEVADLALLGYDWSKEYDNEDDSDGNSLPDDTLTIF